MTRRAGVLGEWSHPRAVIHAADGLDGNGLETRACDATVTTAELADRIDLPEHRAAELLAELETSGHVERHAGGWRLTPTAELRFGAALRRLNRVLDADSHPAEPAIPADLLDAA